MVTLCFSIRNFVRFQTNGNTSPASSDCLVRSFRTSWGRWRRSHHWVTNPHRRVPIWCCTDEATLDLTRPSVQPGMLSGELTVRLDSKIHVPRTVPIPVLAALKRLASLANPVFHEKLRLRFPTFDIPRFLF